MKKKIKTRFTLKSLIRLIIFLAIIYLLISFISLQKPLKIPTFNNPNKVENINLNPNIDLGQNQAMIFIQDKFNELKKLSEGFPQKQIKEIQKMVVKNIYDDTIKKIDSN
ncbi:MAG: hypothetical protein WCG91_01930 [Candidatus Shapirobacteria bacterium]